MRRSLLNYRFSQNVNRTRRKHVPARESNQNVNNNINNNHNNNNTDDVDNASSRSVVDNISTSTPEQLGNGFSSVPSNDVVDSSSSSHFHDLLPHVDAPVDSVGAGSAVLGGASVLQRSESTKRSIRGKVLKLLPGNLRKSEIDPPNNDAKTTTTGTGDLIQWEGSDSPRAAKSDDRDSEVIESGLRLLNRLVVCKSTYFSDSGLLRLLSFNGIVIGSLFFETRSPDLHRRASSNISVGASQAASISGSNHAASSQIASSHFFSSVGDVTPHPLAVSTASLPDATNQNSFTSGF